MLKRCLLSLAIFLSILCVAQDKETFSLTVGATMKLDLPFAVENYRISNKDRISVEEISKKQLNVTARALGECTLQVFGAGVTKEYSITVKSNITNTLKRLRTDLDALPELDLSINQDYIVIKGTVTNPENWKTLQKVLPLYKDEVHSFAVFKPSAETVLNLKKMLLDAGFPFAAEGEKPALGELTMKISPDAIIITGELASQQQADKIRQILSTQTWLSLEEKAGSGQIRGIVNLDVVQTVLQVDVVYVGVTDADADKIGSQAPTLSGSFQYFFDMIAGRKAEGSTAILGVSMDQSVQFLARNGITRTHNAGHVSFLNHDPKGGKLHTGGTLSVKVSGDDGQGSLQDIDYGLNITIKGGLVSEKRVMLDLKLENTALIAATGDTFNRSVDSTQQTIYCDLDKTMVIAGSKKIAQATQKSGLPFLRNVPVLKWFVSEEADSKAETRLLILVSPRLLKNDPSVEIEIPLQDETAKTYKDAQTDNKTLEEEKNEKKSWWRKLF
ncbi:MAG: hypothetical protein GX561_12680 [Lentisphaerae bacterium]|jgi:Flp pilus assembly secretin CpaC|nr:hypothetical protein [Lentisphaerota bacterium]